MHELSIALSIVELAEEELARHGGARVEAVHLKLGPLSGIVKEALLSAYELACEQSPLAGSRLLIEQVPVVAYCPACRAERNIASIQEMICPECGRCCPEIRSGRELELTALEIAS
jgi:hydrogenase nickel incorporation protein HypA/HybF